MTNSKPPVRLAVVADFREEGWESMDLVAEMVMAEIRNRADGEVVAQQVTPRYITLFQRFFKNKRWAWNLDRLVNRRVVLVHGVRRALRTGRFDAVYVVDHSYAHVLKTTARLGVPGLVLCHDLDAFTSLTRTEKGLKQRLRRWFARPILEGLLRAELIFAGSETVRGQLQAWLEGRYDAARIVTNTYGVAPEFMARGRVESERLKVVEKLPGPVVGHVGSTIPRKRIDVLLATVAVLAKRYPSITLVRVGGALSAGQRRLAEELGVWERIVEMPRLSRAEVAEVYRRSDVVLVTSDAEGFGLPVIEALSCGAGVVVSDLPVLREPGGDFVRYAKTGDAADFADLADEVIQEGRRGFADAGLAEHLGRFRWGAHVERLLEWLGRIGMVGFQQSDRQTGF